MEEHPMQNRQGLGQVLTDNGLVTADQLEYAMQEEARSGRSAWRVLVDKGIVAEKDLVRARALQIGLEFFDVRNVRPDPRAVALVPQEIARRQLVLPMQIEGDTLVLAMAEPMDHLAFDEVSKLVGRPVRKGVAYRADLAGAVEEAYTKERVPAAVGANGNGSSGAVGALNPEDLLVEAAPVQEALEEDEIVEKEPNLADFLEAVMDGAGSDLHLTTGLPPMIRVHGELKPLKGYRKLLPKDLREIVYSMITQKHREVFEEKLELDISYSLPGKARFRVNVFQQRDSVGCVMRLIPYEIRSTEQLGLPPAVKEFARLRRGMVLVTGITGSGKSTTLAALIDQINSERQEHIMTIEDPIEFLHKHKRSVVNQREVGTDTHGFGQALKHVLRQDPDVILVGELRDLETIQTALTAAETGHLVFATLHTQDAPQSVDRIIDVFPPYQQEQIRIQLAGCLAGVVSQQLTPTADGKGRAVAAEVLVVTPAVRNLVREGKTHQIYSAMQAGGKHGMQVMDQALAELFKKGKISYETAIERCHHVEEFNRLAGKE
jgi:twitching motility protein PilT